MQGEHDRLEAPMKIQLLEGAAGQPRLGREQRFNQHQILSLERLILKSEPRV